MLLLQCSWVHTLLSVCCDVLPVVTRYKTKETEDKYAASDSITGLAACEAWTSFYLDAVGFCVEIVNLLFLPPNLVSQLLLLVCECVRLIVQPPINCTSGTACISAEAPSAFWLTLLDERKYPA